MNYVLIRAAAAAGSGWWRRRRDESVTLLLSHIIGTSPKVLMQFYWFG